MEYQVTMLMVDQPITSVSSGTARWAPWSDTTGSISFDNPVLSSITIIDDDEFFESGRYTSGETQQALTHDVMLSPGGEPVPAGTQMSNFIGAILRDTNRNPDGSRNEFLAMFPRSYVSGGLGQELGERHAVLIFPQALPNGDVPVFDLKNSYHYAGSRSIGTSKDAVNYAEKTSAPCFATGSLIETDRGRRRIERLTAGDLVLTRDHGLQPIRWIGAKHVDAAQLDLQPNLRPIHISAGAIGQHLPATDLTVSPQHRVLVCNRISKRLFDTGEVLTAAKHLVGLPGIQVMSPPQGVTYYHMLFDRHELVLSNGTWSESLYTGPYAMQSVSAAARREIVALFPKLAEPDFRPNAARRFLTGSEARQMVRRQAKNASRRRLVEPL